MDKNESNACIKKVKHGVYIIDRCGNVRDFAAGDEDLYELFVSIVVDASKADLEDAWIRIVGEATDDEISKITELMDNISKAINHDIDAPVFEEDFI